MSPDPITRLNAALSGRYVIESELGEGGMATVYLADDLKHERKVALKVLKPELAAVVGAERFLAEIKTTANLQHPNILPLFDSGEAGGFLFYVMPYVKGETLQERLRSKRQLPVDEAVDIVAMIAGALDYAHRNGVVHRDIKPANVLLQDGQPVVADFGIALAVQQAGGGRLTETGLSLGTPFYMSPEQATADRDPDARSDVYSLGCVLYELLTGDPPFQGSTAQAVLGRILTGEVTRPTELRKSIPVHVEGAILKAIERLPADRFENAASFQEALKNPAFRYGAVGSVAAGRAPPWKMGAIAMTVLTVVLGGLYARTLVAPDSQGPILHVPIALSHPASAALSLSRDGTKLAYVDADGSAWLRDLTGTDEELLDQGPVQDFPAFSPDDRSVLIYSEGLVVSPLDGRPRRTIGDAGSDVDYMGAEWLTDESVLILTIDEIQRADVDGPDVVRIRENARVSGEYLMDVEATPDPRFVLASYRAGTQPVTVVRLDLLADSIEPIVEGRSPRYVGGHLFFVSGDENLLQAAPYDVGKNELGDPMPLVTDVRGGLSYDVSESGVLVYQLRGPTTQAGVFRVTREGEVEPTGVDVSDIGSPNHVAVSPDGSRVALLAGAVLWVDAMDGRGALRLAREGDRVTAVEWDGQGEYVYFIVARSGQFTAGALFRQRADGSRPPESMIAVERGIFDFSLHPDGRTVALMMEQGMEDGDMAVGDLTIPDQATPLPGPRTGDEHSPALSPDGRWLAFQTNASGRTDIYVVDFPGGTQQVQLSVDGGHSPRWSRSGDELFYVDESDMLWSLALEADSTMSATGRSQLFVATRRVHGLDWIYSTPYDVDESGTFLFADPGESSSGEVHLISDVFRWIEGR